ncbi:hypothetical protein FNAPI_12432 [Fusarium napiforme]|uniref:Uncharacterized protein n=1 Tax=Fusarium napiforme TaxID=42672 RepID=A0A8H5ICE2_9HYPO|nr:hypothetical protein FNAPI_12432 [Fusarium napiforme]
MTVNDNISNGARLIPRLHDTEYMIESAQNVLPVPGPDIWIGYIKLGRNFLDIAAQMPDTEQQIKALQGYHKQKFTCLERLTRKWILCQHPIVLVGELCRDHSNDLEGEFYPREVQFEKLQKSQVLTKGLMHPQSLYQNPGFFHQRSCFNIRSLTGFKVKKALCVGYEVNKAYLIGPLVVSLCLSFATAAVAAVVTQSISEGFSIGGTVEAALALVWSFIMWYLK